MVTKKLCLIAAIGGTNRVIGNNGGLPWGFLKTDLANFSKLSTGNINIMGRKNYESLPDKYRPLPNRTTIVMTENRLWHPNEGGVLIAYSFQHAMNLALSATGERICFIGGEDIFKLALDEVVLDDIYLTTVFGKFPGQRFLPEFPFVLEDKYELAETNHVSKEGREAEDYVIEHYKLLTA